MRLMVVAVLALGGAAWAGKKVVVVGAGDCKDAALLGSIKDFHDGARGVLKDDLFEPDVVLHVVRPGATRSLDDLSRQLDTVLALLNAGENARGLDQVADTLAELERVSPLATPWPVVARALVLQAQMFKNLDRTREMADSFRRLLRVDGQYKLDPNSFAPGMLQALETARRELQRGKKAALQVTSTPPGATVFLDGREAGRTPLKVDLSQGLYRVSLVQGDGLSFPHKVNVQRDEVLQVDMAFEGGVAQQGTLCVTSVDDDRLALMLGLAVGAGQTVVVRNTASRGNPPYVTGSLYERGERVRNGGVRPEQLRDLVQYVFTGKPDISASPPVALAPSPAPAVVKAEPGAVSPPGPLALTAPPRVAPVPALRLASYVGLGVGAALGAAGVITFAAGGPDRDELLALREANGGRLPADAVGGLKTLDAVSTNQALTFALVGTGLGVALAGVLGLVLSPAPDTQVAVVPSLTGLGVAGAF
jgi:hypothetical protein